MNRRLLQWIPFAVVMSWLLTFGVSRLEAQRDAAIAYGMTVEQVRARFGEPTTVRETGDWLYFYYGDPCDSKCEPADLVIFHHGLVAAATVMSANRRVEDRQVEVPPGADTLARPGSPRATTPVTKPSVYSTELNTARRVVVAARVAGRSITVDGRLDETEWRRTEPATGFVQYSPSAGAPASERSEARVLLDGDALLVAIRMYDQHPDSIVGRLGRRDERVVSDWITVLIDSYHDRRTAFAFAVNPRGVKIDALISDDVSSNSNWDAVWDATARVDSAGWTAEFRIPLSQLRFSRCDSQVCAWGINFRRYIARREETSDWSPIPRTSSRLVSAFGELRGVDNLDPPVRVSVRPYSVLRLSQAPGDARNPFYRKNAFTASAGADLTYGLGSAFTLDATFNPDFGQVEADASSVNLTAYETFFPEKRPFFQEGADIFRFNAAGAQLFYSRRIGRSPQRLLGLPDGYFVDAPSASTVLGAAKLSGRTTGGWSLGALAAVTGEENARVADPLGKESTTRVEPLTATLVSRVKRESADGRNGAGFMVTALRRALDDGDGLGFLRTWAYSGGVDLRHRFYKDLYELSGSLLGSAIGGTPLSIARVQLGPGHYFQRPDATYLHYDSTQLSLAGYAGSLSLNRISGAHFTWGVSGSAISPGFEVNDVGFQKEADRLTASAYTNYYAYTPGRLLRSVNFGLNQYSTWSFGRERIATGIGGNLDVQFVNYWGFSLGTSRAFSSLSMDALRGGPAIERAGSTDAWLSVYSGSAGALGVSVYGNVGAEDNTGGHSSGGGASLDLRPAPQLSFSLGPYFSRYVDAWQYVDAQRVSGTTRYFFARLDQRSVSLTGRMNLALAPTLSLQVYSSPFVSSGEYSSFKTVRDFRARAFNDRFHTFSGSEIVYVPLEHSYGIDLDGDGERDLSLWNPDFSVSALNTNVVLRWEYRPGSMLYAAWSLGRSGYRDNGLFQPGRELRGLFGVAADPAFPRTNAFLVKMSYRLGR
jgi:hypothetical protein